VGLENRLSREHLRCDGNFDIAAFSTDFDVAIALSLFTHLPANHIRLCLTRLAGSMAPGGRFYATFFIVPERHPFGETFLHPANGTVTADHSDPYHYRYSDIIQLCVSLPWRPTLIGEWGHPRGQQIVIFEYLGNSRQSARNPDPDVRARDADFARSLPPGADHYRAFVGPPDRYDFMSASQFALLFALGLRDTHTVLDFGCGSLRVGRLLIPFLQPGNYFGIDPNSWLVDDAMRYELGSSIILTKRPSFLQNDDFRCDVFGRQFKFIIVQSIITHCGADLVQGLADEMAKSLEEDGRVVFSIIEAPDIFERPSVDGWVYPNCVSYGSVVIRDIFRQAGLVCRSLPWYHPGARWYIAAHSDRFVPAIEDLWLLRGAVLFDEQFSESTDSPK
jgi:SAM-dependent methyltransferase